jgi:hypothetical protein
MRFTLFNLINLESLTAIFVFAGSFVCICRQKKPALPGRKLRNSKTEDPG